MELIEDSIVELTLLLIRKLEIEKQLRKTFKCFLKKLFTCCGMKNIENELKYLNESIKNLQDGDKSPNLDKTNKRGRLDPEGSLIRQGSSKIKRYSSI